MPSETGDTLYLDRLDLDALNEVLARIRDELDTLRGLRGQINHFDKVNSDAGVTYTDENGVVIHGFGNL